MDIDGLNRTIRIKEDRLNNLADVLKRHGLPYDIEGMADRAKKGWDYERRMAREEIEDYIKNTHAPSYIQADLRQRAADSVDEDMEKELQSALIGWDGTFSKEDLKSDESGRISFTEDYKARMMAGLRKTLSAEETKDLEELRTLLKIYKKLDAHYNMPALVKNLQLSINLGSEIEDNRLASAMYFHRRKR